MQMNGKVILSGVLVAILAIALVGAFVFTKSGQSGTTSGVGSTGQSTQLSNGQSGTLAVVMTDPPTIPQGVTSVYINYSDVQVHIIMRATRQGGRTFNPQEISTCLGSSIRLRRSHWQIFRVEFSTP